MINHQLIQSIFPKNIYNKGYSYYTKGHIQNLYYDRDVGCWVADVSGSKLYEVEVELLDGRYSAYCDCPAFEGAHTCKHIVAVLLEISDELDIQKNYLMDEDTYLPNPFLDQFFHQQSRGNQLPDFTDSLIKAFSSQPPQASSSISTLQKMETLQVEYHLSLQNHLWEAPIFSLGLKVGTNRLYVVKNMYEFLQCIEEKKELTFTKNFYYDPLIHQLSTEDDKVIKLLIDMMHSESFYKDVTDYEYHQSQKTKRMTISPYFADMILTTLKNGSSLKFEHDDIPYFHLDFLSNKIPLNFHLEREQEIYKLGLPFNRNQLTFAKEYHYLIVQHSIYKLSSAQTLVLEELNRISQMNGQAYLTIKRDQIDSFLSHVVPNLKKVGIFSISENITQEILHSSLQSKLFLDWVDERLTAKLEYHYHDFVFHPFSQNDEPENGQTKIVMREIDKEQEMLTFMDKAGFKYNGSEFFLDEEEDSVAFMYDYLPLLEEKSEIYLSSALKSAFLGSANTPTMRVEYQSDNNLLDIKFDVDDLDHSEIRRMINSIVEKKRFHRMANGAFVKLEDDQYKVMSTLFEELNMSSDMYQNGSLSLPAYRGLHVDHLLSSNNAVSYNKPFRQLIQDITHPNEMEIEVPKDLRAEVRDYQKVGFQWLTSLSRYGFGGILADDMGLGKTLQSIAFLMHQKNLFPHGSGMKPALVVAPASLIYNWKAELEKFAPSLQPLVVTGTKKERESLLLEENNADVIITSYPTLRQDVDIYVNSEFSTMILDEAQAIKNSATKTAQAIRRIPAERRYALSGTPIENSLDELWSLFETVLPGYFKSKRNFSGLPLDQITRMSKPFILRRLKKDVLKELPEKIETVYSTELTKAQKQLYLGYLEQIRGETLDALAKEGLQKNRIKILAGITRLRQLCCHPSLFIDNYEGESGKLNQLMEMTQNALENGQRILIFSQFSSMLLLIRQQLEQSGIDSFYLDGSTPSKNRLDMVTRFNKGEKDIFLISMKAGGTGLNLTGADTVILYDLWWNPAIEEQAAGRAHRMGQKKVVQVFRLITKGTIEEKIYELQQKKRDLINNVIQPGETMLSSLSEQDILELLNGN